ncbi:MAG: DUF819 family protein [Sulfurovaceae bacterium]
MIESGIVFLTVLIFIIGIVSSIENRFKWKIFDVLPSIVIIYGLVMILSSLGLWSKNENIESVYSSFKNTLLPSMIFLMLLEADIRTIAKLGKKMIFTFILATVSIMMGFIISYGIFHNYLDGHEAWKSFGALCGSWTGGTGNMIAVQGALNISNNNMGYVLIADSINYTLWVMLLLALVPFAAKFNSWAKADTSTIDAVSEKLNIQKNRSDISLSSLMLLLGSALMVNTASEYLATLLPTTDFITHYTWVVMIATLAGIFFAMTPLAKIGGSSLIAQMMLYFIVALIASRADFSELAQAPLYIIAGFAVLVIHLILMMLFAKLFRLDLFTLGVASLANIGGVASAPILASAYSKALVPIGVLMALMGYIVGTGAGLMVAKILQILS